MIFVHPYFLFALLGLLLFWMPEKNMPRGIFHATLSAPMRRVFLPESRHAKQTRRFVLMFWWALCVFVAAAPGYYQSNGAQNIPLVIWLDLADDDRLEARKMIAKQWLDYSENDHETALIALDSEAFLVLPSLKESQHLHPYIDALSAQSLPPSEPDRKHGFSEALQKTQALNEHAHVLLITNWLDAQSLNALEASSDTHVGVFLLDSNPKTPNSNTESSNTENFTPSFDAYVAVAGDFSGDDGIGAMEGMKAFFDGHPAKASHARTHATFVPLWGYFLPLLLLLSFYLFKDFLHAFMRPRSLWALWALVFFLPNNGAHALDAHEAHKTMQSLFEEAKYEKALALYEAHYAAYIQESNETPTEDEEQKTYEHAMHAYNLGTLYLGAGNALKGQAYLMRAKQYSLESNFDEKNHPLLVSSIAQNLVYAENLMNQSASMPPTPQNTVNQNPPPTPSGQNPESQHFSGQIGVMLGVRFLRESRE